MKKEYVSPQIAIQQFSPEDILTASGVGVDAGKIEHGGVY